MLLNLLKHQLPDVDKFHLHVKDPFEFSISTANINGREKLGVRHARNPMAFLLFTNN